MKNNIFIHIIIFLLFSSGCSQNKEKNMPKITNITAYVLPKSLLSNVIIQEDQIVNHSRVTVCELNKDSFLYFESNILNKKVLDSLNPYIDIRILIVINYDNGMMAKVALSSNKKIYIDKEHNHSLKYDEIINKIDLCSPDKYGW
jgi:hypothetical protein